MRLFLDDERFPPDDGKIWTIVRDGEEAMSLMESDGCPVFMSFDHDLGSGINGYELAHWMVERDIDMQGSFIPETFEFYVHSQNPVGAKNIHSLLTRYLDQR